MQSPFTHPKYPDSAAEFFGEIVEPTAAEFLSHRSDRRRAVLACLALSSMADHYFHARQPEPHSRREADAFRGRAGADLWAFRQVMDIANATKHVARLRDRVGFDDITSQRITLGNLRCGWPTNGTEVMVETEPGKVWLVSQLVEASMEFWRKRLWDNE